MQKDPGLEIKFTGNVSMKWKKSLRGLKIAPNSLKKFSLTILGVLMEIISTGVIILGEVLDQVVMEVMEVTGVTEVTEMMEMMEMILVQVQDREVIQIPKKSNIRYLKTNKATLAFHSVIKKQTTNFKVSKFSNRT